MTASETLLKLIELTNQNLEILGMINESFFTKREHLTTVINDTRYTIPSYIALENKVNHLQAAFNNLVHAPMTGEAYMNFDGNSRVIQMRGFQQGPPTVNLDNQTQLYNFPQFFTEDSHLFKDMLSPKPYIKLDLSELDDDITKVVVKKIVPYNDELINTLYDGDFSILAMDYGVMQAKLTSGNVYKKGVDYEEYDVVYDLPIRKLTCSGEYIVDDVISDEVDDDMNNIIVVQLDESTPTICTLYDGFTTRNLRKGDELTTWDGSARMVIENIQQSTYQLTLRVLTGEYLNILPNSKSVDDKVSDYSLLRFYRPQDFDSDKYLNLPLEEDKYVYVTVAPLNSRMNTQAQWGTGLYINVDSLTTEIVDEKGDLKQISFRDYYKDNVKNIGDTINELAAILPPPLTNLSPAEFDSLLNAKPWMTSADGTIDTLQVVQINKHLNEAENIKTIRNLYAQKQQYKVDLTECQNKIATLTAELSEISFDDMSGSRTMLTAQISDLKAKQNELVASINTAIDAIAQAANDSEVPIEASKFRIRGFVDIDRFLQNNGLDSFKDNIRAVKVRYRYKNPGITELANVSTIGSFLFTEWNNYSAGARHKVASYSNGHYTTSFDDPNPPDNDIKYNQVDIPINQGEQVDIQAKVVWDYGYPFISLESDWSDIVTIKFPQELMADVQVTSIIEENNNDIETYRFENILDNHGITSHTNDYVDDQNIRYYHKPESISSGFYTEERRVIPLADKLRDMNTQLASIQDMLLGTHAESMRVSLTVNNIEYVLKPDIDNVIQLSAYNTVPIVGEDELQTDLERANESAAATTFGSITIKNVTDHTLRLFSMVPGARDQGITLSRRFQRTLNRELDYAEPVKMKTSGSSSSSSGIGRRTLRSQDDAAHIDAGGGTGGGNPNGFGSTGFDLIPIGSTVIRPNRKYVKWEIVAHERLSLIKAQLVNQVEGISITITVGGNTYNVADNGYIDSSPSLNTNDSCTMTVKYDGDKNISAATIKVTADNGGDVSGTVGFMAQGFSNGTVNPGQDVEGTKPYLSISQNTMDFGSLNVGDSLSQEIEVYCYFPAGSAQIASSYGTIKATVSGSSYYKITPVADQTVGAPSIDSKTTTIKYTVTYKPATAGANQPANILFTWSPANLTSGVSAAVTQVSLSCTGTAIGINDSTTNIVTPGNTYVVQSAELLDYEGAKMVYVMNPGSVDVINGVSDDAEEIGSVFKEQPSNCFSVFRIRDPFAGELLGDQKLIEETVRIQGEDEEVTEEKFKRPKGVASLEAQQEIIKTVSRGNKPNESFVYATPATSNIEDLCIQSDAVQSYMEIGPGDSKTIPIFIAYFMQPENPNCAYTLGFDVRNSLYNDPIYYQVTLAARYNQTFSDLLQSQKASVSNQTNYNPVIRS